MHHGEGRQKTGAGGGRKNQLITVPSPGKDESGIKKVLPTGKFQGLATSPFFFYPFFRQLDSLLYVCVLVISHMAAGQEPEPAFSQSLAGAPTVSMMVDAEACSFKGSSWQLVPSLLENSEGFDIL